MKTSRNNNLSFDACTAIIESAQNAAEKYESGNGGGLSTNPHAKGTGANFLWSSTFEDSIENFRQMKEEGVF